VSYQQYGLPDRWIGAIKGRPSLLKSRFCLTLSGMDEQAAVQADLEYLRVEVGAG